MAVQAFGMKVHIHVQYDISLSRPRLNQWYIFIIISVLNLWKLLLPCWHSTTVLLVLIILVNEVKLKLLCVWDTTNNHFPGCFISFFFFKMLNIEHETMQQEALRLTMERL